MASTIALIANPLNLAEIRETKRAVDVIGVRLGVGGRPDSMRTPRRPALMTDY
jgi:hypothetical protein